MRTTPSAACLCGDVSVVSRNQLKWRDPPQIIIIWVNCQLSQTPHICEQSELIIALGCNAV